MTDEKYTWAANPSKLDRAIKEVKGTGKKFKNEKEEEEAVKVVYRRFLGHVKGEPVQGQAADTSHFTEEKIKEAYIEGYTDCKDKKESKYETKEEEAPSDTSEEEGDKK